MAQHVPEEYLELKKEYLIIKKELEGAKQTHYENVREIKRLQALEQDYQTELELLQKENNRKGNEYKEKIIELEQSASAIRGSYQKKVQELEDEVTVKNNLVLKLQTDLESLKSTCIKEENDDTGKLITEINSLRDKNEALTCCLDDLKEEIKTRQHTYLESAQKLKELMGEVEMYKELIADKIKDIADMQNLNEKLTLETLELKQELDKAKKQPLGNSKGNSLFAEVDDRRVYLQTKMSDMKSEYISMKEKYSKQSETLRHLQMEHTKLLENKMKEFMEAAYDEDTIIDAFKLRIQDLEYLLKKSDQEVKSLTTKLETADMADEFYYGMLKEKGKKIEELQNRLISRSLTDTLMAKALKQANEEKRKWKLEATLKDHLLKMKQETDLSNPKIEEIRKTICLELDNLALNSTISKDYVTIMRPASVLSSSVDAAKDDLLKQETNSVEILSETDDNSYTSNTSNITNTKVQEGNKENITDNTPIVETNNRKVQFSLNTISPVKQTNSKRKGGTIVCSKPPQY